MKGIGVPKQVLFLCPEAPYPVLGGGAQRIVSLVEYFRCRGCQVDMLTFVPCQPPPGVFRDVLEVPLPPNGRSLPARVLRNTNRLIRGVPPLIDRLSGLGEQIAQALSGKSYDLAVLEHFWVAPYVELLRGRFAHRVWCDLHNVESNFFQTLAGSSGLIAGLAHRRFARLSRLLEQRFLPEFDGLLVCSEIDRQWIEGLAPGAKTAIFPNTLDWIERPKMVKNRSIVFSGNMEYHPNRQGVQWFYQRVWPIVRAAVPDVRWRLVGMNPEAVAHIVRGDSRVDVTGYVADAIAEIAAAQVAVVPLLSGSGTRVKILEAWAAGTPVVSTAIGAEGLGVADGLRIVENAEQFAAAVVELLSSFAARERLATAGRAIYEQHFHRRAAWHLLDNAGIL